MLPIPFIYITRSTWSGTYSQPNYAWYQMGGPTAASGPTFANIIVSFGGQPRFQVVKNFATSSTSYDLNLSGIGGNTYVPLYRNGLAAMQSNGFDYQVGPSMPFNNNETIIILADNAPGVERLSFNSTGYRIVQNDRISAEDWDAGNLTYKSLYSYDVSGVEFIAGTFSQTGYVGFMNNGLRISPSGYTYEIMFYNRLLSKAEIDDVFGYLAYKWSIDYNFT